MAINARWILLISLFLCVLGHKLPIVYVYTVVPAVCEHGLPDYIKISLEQAIFTQPDCDVMLVSNFADCAVIADSVKDVANLVLIDATKIVSARTTMFKNASSGMFQSDGFGELWMTSALRFFIMEDLFYANKLTEMMHIEADNLLYGPYTSLLPILRSGYKGLAATPLNAHKSFITASVLWISSIESIIRFNNYMLELANNSQDRWKSYLKWLRLYGCCKHGGVDADENGIGIKPFAVNEMSMLAYYHELYPTEFKLLPVVPAYPYLLNKYVCNMSEFGPGGREVGPPTGHGVWDPNSWGQWMGGTSSKRGRDVGFSDGSHVAGQAIRMSRCVSEMICGNQTVAPYAPINSSSSAIEQAEVSASAVKVGCYTAPFIRCGEDSHLFTPLWNLHVHSKHTEKFRSVPCACPPTNSAATSSSSGTTGLLEAAAVSESSSISSSTSTSSKTSLLRGSVSTSSSSSGSSGSSATTVGNPMPHISHKIIPPLVWNGSAATSTAVSTQVETSSGSGGSASVASSAVAESAAVERLPSSSALPNGQVIHYDIVPPKQQ